MSHASPRILITRLSAIGDCIHTMPLVGALRDHLPEAHISWITQPGPSTLLEGYPGLNRVIVVERDWLKSPGDIRKLRRQLRSEEFDIAIDPQSLTKSSLLAWLSGARWRIGFASPQGRELSLWMNNHRLQPLREHVVDRYLELLQPIIGPGPFAARFDLPVQSHETILQFLKQPALTGDFAVLNPGAGWDSKLWLPQRFGRIASHLAQVHRLPSVVVWAGDRERQWAQEIVSCADGHALLAPPTSLPELACLLQRARLCVAADTGPLHLAAAVGTPCVGLYGSTLPAKSGPYGKQHSSVQAFYQDGSSRQRRRATNDAMQAITVGAVAQACDRVLQSPRRQQVA